MSEQFTLTFTDIGAGLESWAVIRPDMQGEQRILAHGYLVHMCDCIIMDGHMKESTQNHAWHYRHFGKDRDAAIAKLKEHVEHDWFPPAPRIYSFYEGRGG